MRAALRVGADTWRQVREHLLSSQDERMAYLLARASRWTDRSGVAVLDLLVTRAVLIPDAALRVQNRVRVEPAPALTRELLITCYETGLSLIDLHTHPFATDHVSFSGHDVSNMLATHADFLSRMPAHPPIGVASLVLGQRGVAGSFTDSDTGALTPLDSLTILGDRHQEVSLCPT